MKFVVVRVPGSNEALLVDCEKMTVERALPEKAPEGSPTVEGIEVPTPDTVSSRMYYHQAQPAPHSA